MKVRSLCPTRIDLAGGTLDLWPLYTFFENSKTINAAISIYTGCEIETLDAKEIQVSVESLKFKKTYKNKDAFLKSKDKAIEILKPLVSFFNPEFGFKVKTFSESPVGGGLGGSSSLTIALIYGFLAVMDIKMEVRKIVHLAHNLEAKLLKTPTGTQDYVPPILGGINMISYDMDSIGFEKSDFDIEDFNSRMVLVYTGRPHHSGLNNWKVLQDIIQGNKKSMAALAGLLDTTLLLYGQLQNKTNFASVNFKKIFNLEYKWRTQLSKGFSSPEIRRLEKITSKKGVEAIKICGAGGGGCVVLLTKKGFKEKVQDICQKEGFQVLNARVVPQGVSVTKV